MERIEQAPRADWQSKLEEVGVIYHSNGAEPSSGSDGGLWWWEGSHWKLTTEEVDSLDDATVELHARCLDAVDYAVNKDPVLLREAFGMPDWFAEYVERSWKRRDPYLMGRMDLAFDDRAGDIKLIEYNADTPTLAIETAVAQWFWLLDTHPSADQFNSLHEKLLERFKGIAPLLGGAPLHFTAFKDSQEEWAHSIYFRDLAQQAGIRTIGIDIPMVGWNGLHFVDEGDAPVRFLHKLYPWEWAVTDAFGPHWPKDSCGVLEPAWKAILSNKALLPLLWKLFPGHPNLLESHMGRARAGAPGEWVEKPCLGREGANVTILRDGAPLEHTDGTYGGSEALFVTQKRAVLPQRDGWNAVIGSWVVGEEAAGIIFRESRETIVRDCSRVVPHVFF